MMVGMSPLFKRINGRVYQIVKRWKDDVVYVIYSGEVIAHYSVSKFGKVKEIYINNIYIGKADEIRYNVKTMIQQLRENHYEGF